MRVSIRLLLKADTVEQLVTDEDLERAWGNANFGGMTPREVIRLGTLKCLAGWYQGYTSKTICTELGLIDSQYRVTAKGRAYIWLSCKRGGDI
jgi:hypothetical protein